MKSFPAVVATLESTKKKLSEEVNRLDQSVLDQFNVMGDLAAGLLALQSASKERPMPETEGEQALLKTQLDMLCLGLDQKLNRIKMLQKDEQALVGLLGSRQPVLAKYVLACTPVTRMTMH